MIVDDGGGSRGRSRQHPQCDDRGSDLPEENTYIVPPVGYPRDSRNEERRMPPRIAKLREIRGKSPGSDNRTTTGGESISRASFLRSSLSLAKQQSTNLHS